VRHELPWHHSELLGMVLDMYSMNCEQSDLDMYSMNCEQLEIKTRSVCKTISLLILGFSNHNQTNFTTDRPTYIRKVIYPQFFECRLNDELKYFFLHSSMIHLVLVSSIF